RGEVIDRVGGYRPACDGWSELDLFLRMAAHGRVYVVVECLYHYRYHGGSLTMSRSRAQVTANVLRQRRCLAAYRAGECYDSLLEAPLPTDVPASVEVEAFLREAAHTLWSGARPEPLPVWK